LIDLLNVTYYLHYSFHKQLSKKGKSMKKMNNNKDPFGKKDQNPGQKPPQQPGQTPGQRPQQPGQKPGTPQQPSTPGKGNPNPGNKWNK
jgi:hypothetical protein